MIFPRTVKKTADLTRVLAAIVGVAMAAPRICSGEVDFARDVRPILAANCFACHGPDPAHREAELRLDVFDSPGEDVLGAAAVIAPGKPAESELIARIDEHGQRRADAAA